MAEPVDLVDKLQDVNEIVLGLIHDLTSNPVNSQEERCLAQLCVIHPLVKSTLLKATELAEDWPGETPP